jgi:hypothetical protein
MLVGGWVVNRLVGWWRVGTFHFPSRSAEVLTALLAYILMMQGLKSRIAVTSI